MIEMRHLLTVLASPEQLGRALKTLDRVAVAMMLTSWLAAAVLMGFALYAANSAGKARQAAEVAAAVEPIVPVLQRATLPKVELEKYAVQLRDRFAKIGFNALPDNGLEVASTEGQDYLEWLAALSYLDTLAPQVRWAVRDLCVGPECGAGAVMRAVVAGERVTFKMPVAVEPSSDGAAPKKS